MTAGPDHSHKVYYQQQTKVRCWIPTLLQATSSSTKVWVTASNECVQAKWPEQKQQGRPSTVSISFKRIFEVAKTTRDSIHEFKVFSLQISSTVRTRKRASRRNKVQHGENEVQQDEDKEEGQKENEVQQEALNKAEHDELEKLNKSSCINLLNKTFYYSHRIRLWFRKSVQIDKH
ncbi:hypothetical protein CU097_014819 [Rhizopus azygosporus]|uniref:Uncharacterized protein n=1 Tax=Rhizopus azygosporus TaxID=86630 RepID=A0A367KEK6_RHIAZ|nr:hypothetical protein CU097_014819 [Rhizopus azygosporus]